MLLLVTILLVLVAAVTLLIGIFSDELALIFISIGASALAAIVLAVLSQVSRRKGRAPSTATGPEPLPARTPAPSPSPAPVAATPSPAAPPAEVDLDAGDEVDVDDTPTEVVPVAAAASTGPAALPIAGYDALRVNEILPKLEGLDLDQLEDVAQHEEAHKNRTTVLNRIDQLMDELEAAEAGSTAPVAAAPVASAVETADVSDDVVEEAAAAIEEIGEPVVAPVTSAADDGFPIPGYDGMSEDELIPLLDSLDADQLEKVADREEAGPNRDAVLDAIDDRLDILEGIVPAPPAKAAAAPAPAPAKKAPAKKATAKKAAPAPAPAKKAAAKKATAAAPAKKAAAKKTAAATTTTKKAAAPAKKAASATTAKKTAAKKTAATVKKATPVKKATAAKKATKR